MRFSGRGLTRTTPREAACRLAEDAIQRAIFQNIRIRGAPGVFAFHPRNGSRDQRTLAGINSGLGVVSGVPDVIIIRHSRVYALELKTERGRVSAVQLQALDAMRGAGCDTGVAYGLDAAIAWLERRGLLRGGAGGAKPAS
jgi:hypothetical protein